MAARRNRKVDILDAAAGIVARAGAAHLTIDGVAAAAGISKGGVLYHFPSKEALLQGMLERLLDQVGARTAAHRMAPGRANADLEARILAEQDQPAAERNMSRALLAAAAEDPSLLAPARQMVTEAFAAAGSGTRPRELGWVLLLATEGLRFLDMLDLLPLNRAERKRVHDRLLAMAREHAA